MKCLLALLASVASCFAADGRAAQLSAALREAALDPGECYRVRDLAFTKEDARIYLTEGYLIFAKPVNGRRVAAVFSADVELGDAEILLLPPHRSERVALANFTNSPNLNEHFRSAVMVFSDDTGRELLEQIGNRKSADMGAMLAGKWNSVVRNFLSSFEVRMVENLLSPRPLTENFFYAALSGRTLGNFDFVYDPRAHDQILVGQIAYRNDRSYFDTWTSFESRSFRKNGRRRSGAEFTVDAVRIDAALDKDLRLRAATTLTVTPAVRIEGVLPLDISRDMTVIDAKIDGQSVELLSRDSLRSDLIRGYNTATFLVVPERPLEAGKSYQVEVRHEGAVVTSAGEGVYFVGSRASWYPNRELQFAPYDVTFRFPKALGLVSTGDIVEDRTEGDWRITRRKTTAPIRFVGFNLGEYNRASASLGGYTVEVYGNRKLESSLRQRPAPVAVMTPNGPGVWPGAQQRQNRTVLTLPDSNPPQPSPRIAQLASEVVNALNFMASRFGPPPFRKLTVSPIPGNFGQGLPGLLYLSTLSYLDPAARPPGVREGVEGLFFSEILQAHETAHQWWGNTVATADYQDDWLMEALSNYAALLYLEKRKGAKAMESVLEEYKARLLTKNEDGKTLESAGPITWSLRLYSSQTPKSWRTITYEKGSWIIHMLRRRMGDERFSAMLAEMCKRYRFRTIGTEEFRGLAAEFMPKEAPDRTLEAFFEQWVYGTGIPVLKMDYSIKGKAPALTLTGTLKQSDVSEDFSALVPVEIQFGRGKSVTEWVRTGNEPTVFTVKLKQMPLKVVMDPGGAVLAKK